MLIRILILGTSWFLLMAIPAWATNYKDWLHAPPDTCELYAKANAYEPPSKIQPKTKLERAEAFAKSLHNQADEILYAAWLVQQGFDYKYEIISPDPPLDQVAYAYCVRVYKKRMEWAKREKARVKQARILRVKRQEVNIVYKRCDNIPYERNINQIYTQCLKDADEYARSIGLRPRR